MQVVRPTLDLGELVMKRKHLAQPIAFVLIGYALAGSLVSTWSETASASAKESEAAGFSPYVDGNGAISLPKGYKQEWAHLGSWAVARKRGSDVFEMHDVYTPRETIAAYNKTGEFPDGTVLVKEVRKTETDRLTTGHAAWSADRKIWFVMIKDQEGRFEDSDHWGDGWGWALFEAKDPTKNVSAGYETSCLDCHAPVEDSDWVYTYGYPDLKQSTQ
jgi:hypothetical protein